MPGLLALFIALPLLAAVVVGLATAPKPKPPPDLIIEIRTKKPEQK